MVKKTKAVLLIILVSFLLVFILVLFNKKDKVVETSVNRVVSTKLELVKSIDLGHNLSVMKKHNDELFFISWNEGEYSRIFRFDMKSNRMKKEIKINIPDDSILMDNYFVSDHEIFGVNKLKGSILEFDYSGAVINEFKYPKRFSRMAKSNDCFLVSGWDEEFNLYHEKLNFLNKTISKVNFKDSYTSKYKINGIALDGFYYQGENLIVNMPYSVNRVFVFDTSLTYKGKMDLIYKPTDYKVRINGKGEIFPDPNNINPNVGGHVDEKNIFYCLTNETTKWGDEKNSFIDLYDLNTLEYLKSFKVSDHKGFKPRQIVVSGNLLYVLFETTLNIYKIN
jgi:hypothetical protein